MGVDDDVVRAAAAPGEKTSRSGSSLDSKEFVPYCVSTDNC